MIYYKYDMKSYSHSLPMFKTRDGRFLKKIQLLEYMHSLNLSTRRLAKLINRPYRTVQGWVGPNRDDKDYIPITIPEWRKIMNLEFVKKVVEDKRISDTDMMGRARDFVNRWAGQPTR